MKVGKLKALSLAWLPMLARIMRHIFIWRCLLIPSTIWFFISE